MATRDKRNRYHGRDETILEVAAALLIVALIGVAFGLILIFSR